MTAAAVEIGHERLARLREAIQRGRVSFPAQAPRFPREYRADVQARAAVLYFVRGWGIADIARRYEMTSSRVRQLLRQWTICAAASGYLERVGTRRWGLRLGNSPVR